MDHFKKHKKPCGLDLHHHGFHRAGMSYDHIDFTAQKPLVLSCHFTTFAFRYTELPLVKNSMLPSKARIFRPLILVILPSIIPPSGGSSS